MHTDSIKYSSQKQLREFFGLMSPEELNNLRDFIEGKMKVCDNPQIEECANDLCIITNYVGRAINIARTDLRKYLEAYIKA